MSRTPYDRWLHFIAQPGRTFPDGELARKIMAIPPKVEDGKWGHEDRRRRKRQVNRVAKQHGASKRLAQ